MASLTQVEITAIQTEINPFQSKRKRMLVATQRLLQTLTKDRGYSLDVQEVDFNLKGWDQKSAAETPFICPVSGPQRVVQHAGLVREYEWTVHLFCVCRDITTEDREQFITDIEQCIYDNNTIAGQVNKSEISQIIPDMGLFADQGIHTFEVVLLLQYTRSARDAR